MIGSDTLTLYPASQTLLGKFDDPPKAKTRAKR